MLQRKKILDLLGPYAGGVLWVYLFVFCICTCYIFLALGFLVNWLGLQLTVLFISQKFNIFFNIFLKSSQNNILTCHYQKLTSISLVHRRELHFFVTLSSLQFCRKACSHVHFFNGDDMTCFLFFLLVKWQLCKNDMFIR